MKLTWKQCTSIAFISIILNKSNESRVSHAKRQPMLEFQRHVVNPSLATNAVQSLPPTWLASCEYRNLTIQAEIKCAYHTTMLR